MNILCSVTEEYDVKVDVFEGPLMTSIILALEDESSVVGAIQSAFRDARALKAGFTHDEVDQMNRERAGATTQA